MKAQLPQVSRADKAILARAVHTLLSDRAQAGPPEPTLDAYIPELAQVAERLDEHIMGNVVADGTRALLLAKLEIADEAVDTWYRHIAHFFDTEGRRRTVPHAVKAQACREAAFPQGLGYVDARIIDENRYCRDALVVLHDPENAALLTDLHFPLEWLTRFAEALDASDAALDEVVAARTEQSTHIAKGQDAEGEWVDLMVRLRRYMASRAKRTDKARIEEGQALLRPLLDELRRLSTEAAARATRKADKAASPPSKPNGAPPPNAPPLTP